MEWEYGSSYHTKIIFDKMHNTNLTNISSRAPPIETLTESQLHATNNSTKPKPNKKLNNIHVHIDIPTCTYTQLMTGHS